ncbi:hypothetical protein ACVIRO_002315 [Rhizobium ruizarguesonis]
MTFGDLVREAREIGRRGDREEIDRFTAQSYTHRMIMSGRIGASVPDAASKEKECSTATRSTPS